jgi:predicted dehydrogenase
MTTIRAAFVGCTHPHIFPRIQLLNAAGVEIVGCYDPDAHLAAVLERDYGLKAYPTPDALLDQDGVNFVIIEGWDPDNPPYVDKALERGQAILLEKPGAPNLPAMRAMIDKVRAANVPFQVGYARLWRGISPCSTHPWRRRAGSGHADSLSRRYACRRVARNLAEP